MEKVLAVDIGASKIRIQTVDRDGSLGPMNSINIVGLNADNKKFIEILSDNIKVTMGSAKSSELLAISIGSPGPLDPFRGIIEDTPNLKDIKNLAIVDELKDIFNLPIFLLNDADAAGLGEWWLGAGRGFSQVVMLTLGTGVGSAVIADGKLQRGLGNAAEWGHASIFVENDQRLCSCGQWSCAEAYLGTNGLAETYVKIFGLKSNNLTPEDRHMLSPTMREGIKTNDPKWLQVQETYTGHLAALLRNIIMVHQPEVIILGGGIAFGDEVLLENTRKELKELMDLRKNKMAGMNKGINIVLAKFENAGNLGAAKYAFDMIDTARKGEKAYGNLT